MKLQWDLSELIDFTNNLGDFSKFENAMHKAAKRLSEELLRRMKELTPIEEGTLINGWNGNNFAVTKKDGGFEVLIVNKTPYALAVNDGHQAYNQYGGPYPIKNRIKVVSPHTWQQGSATYYVFGHFFVERGILRISQTAEIEQIIMNELKKWWDSV